MSALHPTTAALLAALRHDHHTGGLGSGSIAAHRQWGAAGCPDAPEPRFVPTEPGWYWRRRADSREIVDVCGPGALTWFRSGESPGYCVTDDGLWLGPVAPWAPPSAHPDPGPCPPKPRTAEEARKEPMPGDRWRVHAGSHYALDVRDGAKWRVRWSNGDDDAFMADSIGEPGETYLGNFPVDP